MALNIDLSGPEQKHKSRFSVLTKTKSNLIQVPTCIKGEKVAC